MIGFSKGAASAVAMLALAGCAELNGGGDISAQTQVTVADGAVVIAGPRGFCVDPRSTRTQTEVPFVLMGNCASISGDGRAPQPGVKAVLTATVAELDPSVTFDSEDTRLVTFFEGEAGRAAISRAGDAATVEVLETFARDGVFFIHARDTSPGPVDNLDDTHWRAVFGVNGRVVSASVLDFQERALTPDRSVTVLTRFAERIRAQSVGRSASVAPTPAALPAIGLFRRILAPTQ